MMTNENKSNHGTGSQTVPVGRPPAESESCQRRRRQPQPGSDSARDYDAQSDTPLAAPSSLSLSGGLSDLRINERHV